MEGREAVCSMLLLSMPMLLLCCGLCKKKKKMDQNLSTSAKPAGSGESTETTRTQGLPNDDGEYMNMPGGGFKLDKKAKKKKNPSDSYNVGFIKNMLDVTKSYEVKESSIVGPISDVASSVVDADDPNYETLAHVKDEQIWNQAGKLKPQAKHAFDPDYMTMAGLNDEDVWVNKKDPHDPQYQTLANVRSEVWNKEDAKESEKSSHITSKTAATVFDTNMKTGITKRKTTQRGLMTTKTAQIDKTQMIKADDKTQMMNIGTAKTVATKKRDL